MWRKKKLQRLRGRGKDETMIVLERIKSETKGSRACRILSREQRFKGEQGP
jgi:hypothetical protein